MVQRPLHAWGRLEIQEMTENSQRQTALVLMPFSTYLVVHTGLTIRPENRQLHADALIPPIIQPRSRPYEPLIDLRDRPNRRVGLRPEVWRIWAIVAIQHAVILITLPESSRYPGSVGKFRAH